MLSNLDPHSSYLDADSFKELQVGTQGEFGGLGIEVGMADGQLNVVSPIDDTPAAKAGIEAGDLVGAGVARGQDEHGQAVAAPAQVGQHRQAIPARQAEIEHAGVVGVIEQREAGRFAVAHPVDRIVTEFQAGDDAVAENRVVFNQQNSQLLLFLFEFF
jgi:C-terminal processing protease CtpA/Prc